MNEPTIQTEDIHSERNFGLKDLTMSNLFNSHPGLGFFKRDRCCHLLLSHHTARHPECSGLGKSWEGFGASPPVQWLGTSQCLVHFRLLATPILNSQKNLLTHRWDKFYTDPFKFLNII